jgi:hypothetical protein
VNQQIKIINEDDFVQQKPRKSTYTNAEANYMYDNEA